MDIEKENKTGNELATYGGKFIYIAVFTCNLISLSGGLSGSWTSPVIPKLNNASRIDENPLGKILSSGQESWIGSLLALGAVFGPLPYGYLSDKIGRKRTLLAIAGPLIIATFTLAFAKSVHLYYAARFLAGLASGGLFTVVPMYVGEISENSNRGMMGSSMNCFIATGVLLSYSVGPYTSVLAFSLFCSAFPTLFFVIFLVFIPESPYYLLAKGKHEQAEAALMKLRSQTNVAVQKELKLIREDVDKAAGGSFLDIFKSRGLIKAFTISLSLIILQQFTGITIVLMYSQSIFEATGSTIPAAISSIIIGAVQLGASFVTPILADSLGRKILLLISATGLCIAETLLGLYFYLKDNTGTDVEPIFWLPVTSLVIYIISYNVGFGPIPWALMGELFPTNVKSGASVATATTCWILGFLTTKFFNTAVENIGMSGSFWTFAGFCIIADVFVITYLPETKGKSFKEIQEILES